MENKFSIFQKYRVFTHTDRKMLRYYGIYAHSIDKKFEEIDGNIWAKAVEHSF